MSLLQRAKDAGEEAKVISVLGWMESSTWMILGYRSDSPCTVVAAAAYHDLAIESFAAQPPDIAFAHIYQAIVRRAMLKTQNLAINRLYGHSYPFTIFLTSVRSTYSMHFWRRTNRSGGTKVLGKGSGKTGAVESYC